jgi:hypothetical protein
MYGGAKLFLFYALMPDPYLDFMRDCVQMRHPFSECVVKTFPIGSNSKDAIAQASRGGFRQMTSTSHSVELLWTRRAVICNEHYFIIIDLSADGTVAKATGRRHNICL